MNVWVVHIKTTLIEVGNFIKFGGTIHLYGIKLANPQKCCELHFKIFSMVFSQPILAIQCQYSKNAWLRHLDISSYLIFLKYIP